MPLTNHEVEMTKKTPENLTFEQSIGELETIVNQLEQGELSLEQSMALFERGLALSYAGQDTLSKAEQKIQVLLNKHGEQQLQDVNDLELDQ